MSNCSTLYRDSYNASDCYEFATVSEMNGVTGAVPIPASTAQRFYQTQASTNSMGQVQNPIAGGNIGGPSGPALNQPIPSAADQLMAAAKSSYIRYNRGF